MPTNPLFSAQLTLLRTSRVQNAPRALLVQNARHLRSFHLIWKRVSPWMSRRRCQAPEEKDRSQLRECEF